MPDIKPSELSETRWNQHIRRQGQPLPTSRLGSDQRDRRGEPSSAELKAKALMRKLDSVRYKPAAPSPSCGMKQSSSGLDVSSHEMQSTAALASWPSEKTIEVNGMLVNLHDDKSTHKEWSSRTKLHSAQELVQMMQDVERSIEPKTVAEVKAKQKREAEIRVTNTKALHVNASYEPPQSYGAWLRELTSSSEVAIDLPKSKTNAAKEQERKDAANKFQRKQQRKVKLEHQAEQAKMRFGLSTFEKEKLQSRRDQLKRTAYEQEQQRGLQVFLRSAPLNMFTNLLAAGAQAFILATVLIGVNGTENIAPLPPAPPFVFIFSFAGVFGSMTNLFCLLILYSVILTQGIKATSMPIICKAIVACQYLSKTAQAYSLVSLILNFNRLITNITDRIDPDDSFSAFTAILQVACAVLLLPLLAYVFITAHTLCFTELAMLVSRETLAYSYAINIEIHQVVSAVSLLVFSVVFSDAVRKVDEDSLLIYNYGFATICAGICLLFSVSHYRIIKTLTSYEDRTTSINTDKELIIQSLRPKLADKEACRIAYHVEKPSLVGKRGVIVGSGIDTAGLVTVLVEGVEYKVQEYQMERDVPEDEKIRAKDESELRVAELENRLENDKYKLDQFMTLYIVSTQLFAGLQVVSLTALLLWDSAASLRHYDGVLSLSFQTLEFNVSGTITDCELGARLGLLSADQEAECTASQRYLCNEWTRCSNNNSLVPNPSWCNQCSLGPRFKGNDAISVPILVVFFVIFAICGGGCGFRATLKVANGSSVRANTYCCMTLLAALVLGVLGIVVGYIASFAFFREQPAVCSEIDLYLETATIERLPESCYLGPGRQYVDQEISLNAKGALIASTVAAAIFVLESSLLLSRKVREINPNNFARFEASISFSYTLFSVLSWLGINFGRKNGYFDFADTWTNTTTYLGIELERRYDNISIDFDQIDISRRQEELAQDIWMSENVLYLSAIVIGAIQFIGLSFSICRLSNWMIGVKAVMWIDALLMAYFVFITYLCMIAVNVTYNLLAFCLLPAIVQYLFAVTFIITSDIWPTNTNGSGFHYLVSVVLGRYVPIGLPSVLALGLAEFVASRSAWGFAVIAVSSIIILSSLAILMLLGCSELMNFFVDWCQLMSTLLFPSRGRKFNEDESERDEESADAAGEEEAEADAEHRGFKSKSDPVSDASISHTK